MTDKITSESPKAETKKSLKTKITDFINDTATLDVLTLTGDITLVAPTDISDGSNSKEAFNWDNIFKNITKELKADPAKTKVSVVAYTHAEWDQDSVNYVAKGADADLVSAHGRTVASAHEARLNALKSVADAVEKLF